VTADKCGGLKTIGRYMVNVEFQGVKVSSNALLEISENIREDIELIIGRPGINS